MDYFQPLIKAFEEAEDPEKAQWSKDYLKGKFEFYGIAAQPRRKILKDFTNKYGYPEVDGFFEAMLYLWDLPQREFQHSAVDMLRKFEKHLKEEHISEIERLIVSKSWWDTVDGLAAWTCGAYFNMYPEQILPVTQKWMESGNMWLQRSVLLFQLKYKERTNTILLTKWIVELAEHKDFFIRKAIGWVLREYGKTNPDWVVEFVENHQLSGLSRKEALRKIKK